MERRKHRKARGVSAWLRHRSIRGRIRALVSYWRLYAARFDHPSLVDLPPGKRVLVLSPHPDDETMGPGGTLLKHHQAGALVASVVLTDGAAGDPGQERAALIQTRKAEAEAAARHLGITSIQFLDEPDGALAVREETVAKLRGILREFRPDLLYVPFFLDSHPDHRAVTPLLHQCASVLDLECTCCAYETWTPLYPNILVDISLQMNGKQKAMNEYRSQLIHVDYIDLLRSLNRYRTSQFSRLVDYAEAFYSDSLRGYFDLWKSATC